MADHWIIKDGAWKKLNDSQFDAEFGHTPTTPKAGETSFGGRYEHLTFNSSSFNTSTGFPTTETAEVNTGVTSFAGLEVGSGSST